MKSITQILILVSVILLSSCGSKEDDMECSVNSVKVFNRASTNFTFSKRSDGSEQLDLVTVYDGTDSSYTFSYSYSSDGNLTNVIRTEDGTTVNYFVTLDGSKVSKLTSKTLTGQNSDEIRLQYSGQQVTQTQTFLANSNGTLFQVGHNAYTYDGSGNLTKRETYLDLASLFALLFGVDPTQYSALLLDNVSYEASGSSNPLHDHIFIDNFDLTVMASLPKKITTSSSTENYSIDNDGNGLPIKSTSGSKYIEISYACQ